MMHPRPRSPGHPPAAFSALDRNLVVLDRPSAVRAATPRWLPLSWKRLLPVAVIFTVAFLARLSPTLRGSGLYGLNFYDDGVHFAAATGFVHGRLPYRDFLLLHPPGIVLALAPFAVLGHWVGDATRLRSPGSPSW